MIIVQNKSDKKIEVANIRKKMQQTAVSVYDYAMSIIQ